MALEEDGTIIDDDDVLLEYHTKTVILLAPGQHWTPAVESSEAGVLSSSSSVTPTQLGQASGQPITAQPISCPDVAAAGDVEQRDAQPASSTMNRKLYVDEQRH